MQKMITAKSAEDLAGKVNYMLARGATVVPGTVAILIDPNSVGPSPSLNPFHRRNVDANYVCTLEMSDDVFKKLDEEEKAADQAKQDAIRDQRRKERRATIHAQRTAATKSRLHDEAIKKAGTSTLSSITSLKLSGHVYRKLQSKGWTKLADILNLHLAQLEKTGIGPDAVNTIRDYLGNLQAAWHPAATLRDYVQHIPIGMEDAAAIEEATNKQLQEEIASGKLS